MLTHSRALIMPTTKYIVRLNEQEQDFLESIVSKGKGGAFKIRRAQILLHSDVNGPQASAATIAKMVHCRKATVYDVRKLLVENSFEGILERKKWANPPIPRLFDSKAEAQLLALACSEAVEGLNRWTLQLLSERVVELDIVPHCTANTIHEVLKRTKLSLI